MGCLNKYTSDGFNMPMALINPIHIMELALIHKLFSIILVNSREL
jgi:hypothetical protein